MTKTSHTDAVWEVLVLYYKNSHGQNEVNQIKKKTLVPLIIFLLGICLVSLIVYKTLK